MGTDTSRRNEGQPSAADETGTATLGPTLGAALGGAAAGAAVGTLAGPAGAVAGAAAGALLGGWAGKTVAEHVDPAAENSYWENNFRSRPYTEGASYEDYGPAYRYGINAFRSFPDRSFEDMEPELSRHWPHSSEGSTLGWEHAQHATRDAWTRLSDAAKRLQPGPGDTDMAR